MKRSVLTGGSILLEAMVAVSIFAVAVVGLGKCVENCLVADRVKNEDARARLALANRMAEIEAGSVVIADKGSEQLKGMFDGMTLKTTRTPLKRKNEKGQEIFGVFAITLELSWKTNGQEFARELSFYVYPRQR